ncbi:Trm112 family protein [Nesterenkonia sp. PF2B19]|uniref:Trm112 family protein n=1 Tax=unclassified Nesterenkonia TaxID=2629769 RepID=UPI0008734796|nr:hypothetical protein [Nesterenkonia sp. PF2B19]OSM42181.1 hypothetical protein BCY76_016005 [Nesterenkonia sp. PF2B19]
MPSAPQTTVISPDVLEILRCPVTAAPLRQDGDHLVSVSDDTIRYPIEHGVPRLLADAASSTTDEETPTP